MNTKIKFTVSILLCMLIITGCKFKKGIDAEAENDIKFETVTVNEKYYLLGDTTNPYCTLESSFTFPSEYKDEEILRKLNRHFIESFFGFDAYTEKDTALTTPKRVMDNYVQKYIADYKELENDFITEAEVNEEKPSQESWYAYYEISSNEILFNKSDLISYIVSVEYYTGGAHGGQGYNNHVLSLKTGKEVSESDIFIDNYEDSLAFIIVYTLALDHNVENTGELENKGFFNIEEIYPNGNFYVDEDGITYTFNVYEIAPYALGKIDVFLSYEKILHLLKKNSPIAPIAFK